MLSFLVSKKKRQQRIDAAALISLKDKLEQILAGIKVANALSDIRLDSIVGFFNYMEKTLAELTPQELAVAPEELQNVIRTVGRDEYGWFRAPKGRIATNENTFIQPTGHFDEVFRTHTVAELLAMKDKPSDQGGFAPRPMTNKEFYNYKFVTPFIMDKVKALETAINKLQ